MGRKRREPTTRVGTLIHEYLGPRTYRWVRDTIAEYHSVERTEEAIRTACRGEANPSAGYQHRGLRPVGGEPPTLELIRRVLGIPEKDLWEALAADWVEKNKAMVSNGMGYCPFCELDQEQRRHSHDLVVLTG